MVVTLLEITVAIVMYRRHALSGSCKEEVVEEYDVFVFTYSPKVSNATIA